MVCVVVRLFVCLFGTLFPVFVWFGLVRSRSVGFGSVRSGPVCPSVLCLVRVLLLAGLCILWLVPSFI